MTDPTKFNFKSDIQGITITDNRGRILKDDVNDWQPRKYVLPPYPNPSTGRFIFRFTVPRLSNQSGIYVKLSIIDENRKIVQTILDGYKPVGLHQIEWTDHGELPLKKGVYKCLLIMGNTKKRIISNGEIWIIPRHYL